MIQEWFIILMILSDGDSISSVNHATADQSLNVFMSQRECEAALPEFVNATYPEFRPQANLLNHQVVMNGVADSPAGQRAATWRCTTIFTAGGSVTPAIDAAKSAGIDFQIREYQHPSNAGSYGLKAVQKLGLHPEPVFKTLVVSDDNSLFVGIIPVSNQLNMKLITQTQSLDGGEAEG